MDEARLDDQAEDRAPRATFGTRRRALKGLRADANKDAAFVFPSRPSKTGYRVEIEPDWKELSAAAQLTGVRLHDLATHLRKHLGLGWAVAADHRRPLGPHPGEHHAALQPFGRRSAAQGDGDRRAVITGKPSAEIGAAGQEGVMTKVIWGEPLPGLVWNDDATALQPEP